MPIVPIESIDDPRILAYRDLPRSRLPRDAGLFIAEGRLLVELLLSSDFQTDSVLVDAKYLDAVRPLVSDDIPCYLTRRDMVKQIVGYNFHRGIIACGRRKQVGSASALKLDEKRPATVVVCLDVHDPENLGGIIRNCAAFAVDAVLLSPQCCDPFSRRLLRVSMGNVLHVPIVESSRLEDDLRYLKTRYGFQLTATVLDRSAEPIHRICSAERQILLLGNEAHGVNKSWLKLCDQLVTIPIRGGVDSLNVAVASGICLYYLSAGKLDQPPASDPGGRSSD